MAILKEVFAEIPHGAILAKDPNTFIVQKPKSVPALKVFMEQVESQVQVVQMAVQSPSCTIHLSPEEGGAVVQLGLGQSPQALPASHPIAQAFARNGITVTRVASRQSAVLDIIDAELHDHCTDKDVARAIGLNRAAARALKVQAEEVSLSYHAPTHAVRIATFRGDPQVIRMQSIISNMTPPFSAFGLPLLLGETIDGEALAIDLANGDQPHFFFAGQTKSGKSTALHLAISGMLRHFEGEKFELHLVDIVKRGDEFGRYGHQAHVYKTDKEEFADLLAKIVALYEYRYETATKGHFVVVVIDEVDGLLERFPKEEKEAVLSNLKRLVKEGRAARVHLVIATQRPSAGVLDMEVKAQLGRATFKMQSAHDWATVWAGDTAVPFVRLRGFGDGITVIDNKTIRFQGAMI